MSIGLTADWVSWQSGRRSYIPSQRDHPVVDTKLYCLVTEAHHCKQLAHRGLEPTICESQVCCPASSTTASPLIHKKLIRIRYLNVTSHYFATHVAFNAPD